MHDHSVHSALCPLRPLYTPRCLCISEIQGVPAAVCCARILQDYPLLHAPLESDNTLPHPNRLLANVVLASIGRSPIGMGAWTTNETCIAAFPFLIALADRCGECTPEVHQPALVQPDRRCTTHEATRYFEAGTSRPVAQQPFIYIISAGGKRSVALSLRPPTAPLLRPLHRSAVWTVQGT